MTFILPPCSESSAPAWTPVPCLPAFARARGCIADDEQSLVREVLDAQRRFHHRRFLEALRRLSIAVARPSVDAIARVASAAYGVEAVQLVASIAGRWAHATRPTVRDRRRIAQTLTPKALGLRVDATALACLLAVEADARLWLALARRMQEPPFLVFDIVRVEIARRPSPMLATLREAAREDEEIVPWWSNLARRCTFHPTCGCGDCAS